MSTIINSNININAEVKDTHRPPFMSPAFNLSKKNVELEGKEEFKGKRPRSHYDPVEVLQGWEYYLGMKEEYGGRRPRSNYDPVEVLQGWEYYLAMKEECGGRRPRSNYDPVEALQGWEFYFNNTNLFNV